MQSESNPSIRSLSDIPDMFHVQQLRCLNFLYSSKEDIVTECTVIV